MEELIQLQKKERLKYSYKNMMKNKLLITLTNKNKKELIYIKMAKKNTNEMKDKK